MGQETRLLDILDERPLTKDEIWEFCVLLFGKRQDLPNPNDDWWAFLEAVDDVQKQERKHKNPWTQAPSLWINIRELAYLEE